MSYISNVTPTSQVHAYVVLLLLTVRNYKVCHLGLQWCNIHKKFCENQLTGENAKRTHSHISHNDFIGLLSFLMKEK
jgi:hypothetical protein